MTPLIQAKKGVTCFTVHLEFFLVLESVREHKAPSLFRAIQNSGTLYICPTFFNLCDVPGMYTMVTDLISLSLGFLPEYCSSLRRAFATQRRTESEYPATCSRCDLGSEACFHAVVARFIQDGAQTARGDCSFYKV